MVEEKQEGGRILPPPPGKIGLKHSYMTIFMRKGDIPIDLKSYLARS